VAADRELVPANRLGTALGLMWVVQNAGIGGANLVAGWLNDAWRRGAQNPAGYQPMMWYFFRRPTAALLRSRALETGRQAAARGAASGSGRHSRPGRLMGALRALQAHEKPEAGAHERKH
jgi:hypothetical protein